MEICYRLTTLTEISKIVTSEWFQWVDIHNLVPASLCFVKPGPGLLYIWHRYNYGLQGDVRTHIAYYVYIITCTYYVYITCTRSYSPSQLRPSALRIKPCPHSQWYELAVFTHRPSHRLSLFLHSLLSREKHSKVWIKSDDTLMHA